MDRRAESIILRRVAFGDADWIITFLSRENGKMSGMAKSARSSKKRFGGALEVGTLVELSYKMRRGSDLVAVNEARVLRSSTGVMKSLERISGMSRALELALAFLPEHQPVQDKFDLLSRRLEVLSQNDTNLSEDLSYELGWLRACGFAPELKVCQVCGKGTDESGQWHFDLDHGGILCSTCNRGIGRRISLFKDDVVALKELSDGSSMSRTNVAAAVIRDYINHVLGKELRVWKV